MTPDRQFMLVVACIFGLAGVFRLSGAPMFSPAFAQSADSVRKKAETLNRLFDQLQRANTSEQAAEPIRRIWDAWLQSGDPDIDRDMQHATIAMNRQRFDVATTKLDVLVKQAPDYAEAWNKRATVHYLVGRLDASLADIEKTLALEPRHFGALSGRALVLTAKGDKRGALIAIEQALKVNPFLSGAQAIIEQNGGTFHSREPI